MNHFLRSPFIVLVLFIAQFCSLALVIPDEIWGQERRTLTKKRSPRSQTHSEEYEFEEGKFSTNPAARLEYEFERTRDPLRGELPDEIKIREQVFAARLPNHELPTHGKSGKPPFGASTQSLQWATIGPTNVGGRTRAVGIDVGNEKNLLAGGVTGGVWRSIDGGDSWANVSAPSELAGATCIAQDTRPGKRNVWYYGTGEMLTTTQRRVTANLRTIALDAGTGIFKSSNGGTSWQVLPSTRSRQGMRSTDFFRGVWNIAIDPSKQNEDVLYAACYGGIMRSTDGGTSWSLVLGDTNSKAFCSDVVVTAQGVVYALVGSTEDGRISPKQGLWRSEDGVNWVNITPLNEPSIPVTMRRVKLALAPSNERVVYVLSEAPRNWSNRAVSFDSQLSFGKYIFRSGSGAGAGGEWENRFTGAAAVASTLAGYAFALAVKPDDENFVLIGGTDLFRSPNGFATRSAVQNIGGYPYVQSPTALHPDMQTIVFSRSNPNEMYVGCDGGVYKTSDVRAVRVAWQAKNSGVTTTQFYYVALDHSKAGDSFVIGGLQDNSTFYTASDNPKTPWVWAFGGDGTACAVTNNKQFVLASSQFGFLYGFTLNQMGEPVVNEFFSDPVADAAGQYKGQPLRYNFCTFFALEPNETRQLYLPAWSRLFRYADLMNLPKDSLSGVNDVNWQEMPLVQSMLGNTIISALGISTKPAHTLYVGTATANLFRVNNANSNDYMVTNISSRLFPTNAFISSIDVDARDANKILIAFSNYNVPSLFVSTAGGATWTDVSGNLEDNPNGTGDGPSVRCVKSVTSGGKTIYFAGTSVGLFSTVALNGNQTVWKREGASTIGNLMVESVDARQSDGRVIAGTYGGGVFMADIAVSEPALPTHFMVEHPFPHPLSQRGAMRFLLPERRFVSANLYNELGQHVATLLEESREEGLHVIEFDLTSAPLSLLPSGIYFCRLNAGSDVVTRTCVINDWC